MSQLYVVIGVVGEPFVTRQRHPVFGIDSEAVCNTVNAVNIVEVANDLCGDRDLIVVETVVLQTDDVGLFHTAGAKCQLDGEATQRSAGERSAVR